jgi:hypothetical protein
LFYIFVFYFVCSVFCIVLFLLLHIAVSFLFFYKFTDRYRVGAQLQ